MIAAGARPSPITACVASMLEAKWISNVADVSAETAVSTRRGILEQAVWNG
jgi:hypothetical protein